MTHRHLVKMAFSAHNLEAPLDMSRSDLQISLGSPGYKHRMTKS